MNILLIHQYFLEDDDSGGSRWNEIAKVWEKNGNNVTVLAGMIHANKFEKRPEYKGRYFVYRKQGGVNVWRCHVSESYNKSFVGRLWGYFSFMISSLWAGLTRLKGKYDVVIVTSPPLFVGFSGYIISRVKRSPFVFEVRDLWPESAIDTGILTNKFIIRLAYWFEKFVYRKASLINVLTPAFRKKLIEEKGVPPSKITFIPNAADFSLSDQLLRDFDCGHFRLENNMQGKLVCTYVGAHGVANHLTQILDVAEQFKGKPVLFQLIGDGMQKKMLKKQAEMRELDNVRFIDSVSKQDVFKYILSSDVGMSVLKKADTFKTVYSNKTFDYMSCKKPIIMAIDGVSRELIESANAGIYAEPENVQAYTAAINYYIENPEMMIQQGENGYRYAKNFFDREKLAFDYLGHLQDVTRQPRTAQVVEF